mmetsp:Transcript_41751/g.100185  ORF Transcript_41751/g.100185 Transcript_41751/m.100185 type:complete len:531 (-) Transcript_41751:192-1784(-)
MAAVQASQARGAMSPPLNPHAKEFSPSPALSFKGGRPTRARASTDGTVTSRRSRNVAGPSDPAGPDTLVLKNVSISVTKDSLKELLAKVSLNPEGVELHTDTSGQFKGTVFVKFKAHAEAKAALSKLLSNDEVLGRKVRVEFQRRPGGRDARASLESNLCTEELAKVKELVEAFVASSDSTADLPSHLTTQMRKYAHSLAERHGLAHRTEVKEGGHKCVFLSKLREPKGRTPQGSPSVGYTDAAPQQSPSQVLPSVEETSEFQAALEDFSLGPMCLDGFDSMMAAGLGASPFQAPLRGTRSMPTTPLLGFAATGPLSMMEPGGSSLLDLEKMMLPADVPPIMAAALGFDPELRETAQQARKSSGHGFNTDAPEFVPMSSPPLAASVPPASPKASPATGTPGSPGKKGGGKSGGYSDGGRPRRPSDRMSPAGGPAVAPWRSPKIGGWRSSPAVGPSASPALSFTRQGPAAALRKPAGPDGTIGFTRPRNVGKPSPKGTPAKKNISGEAPSGPSSLLGRAISAAGATGEAPK